jgi:hypothetical protein
LKHTSSEVNSNVKEFNCNELDEKDIQITSNDNNMKKKKEKKQKKKIKKQKDKEYTKNKQK